MRKERKKKTPNPWDAPWMSVVWVWWSWIPADGAHRLNRPAYRPSPEALQHIHPRSTPTCGCVIVSVVVRVTLPACPTLYYSHVTFSCTDPSPSHLFFPESPPRFQACHLSVCLFASLPSLPQSFSVPLHPNLLLLNVLAAFILLAYNLLPSGLKT